MSEQYQKLSNLLKELFQSDQADLDFGIYRIINQRRDEINRFLDEELLPQVKTAFSKFQSADKNVLQNDLDKAIKTAKELGYDPETAPRVQEIREQMATYSVDVDDLENQVYSALYNFFRRYYDNGDFISQRRYKEGVYAIPYEGEEVKLYWANHDQYYIKTSEYFRDYSFRLPSGKRAYFKLVEADTEKDNRKEIDESKRRFVLAEEPLTWQDGEVVIRFEFRPESAKQSKCNEETLQTIQKLRTALKDQAQKASLTALFALAPTEASPDRTLLEKHLEDYTRRNTQDYFIHKDLGKFLRRELDFFIKNEVMHLDNIENERAPRVEEYLSKIKVIRQIAHKIIDFLAQIEDFQKKLWLKKKFVVETNYCITLDRIPEELYPEIAANDAQREEWVRLFNIDEIKRNGKLFKVSYSNPLTVEFLKANPYLVVDTKLFDFRFKYHLLNMTENLEEQLDGILIDSENFQALNLIQTRYQQEIDYIYIDPPYNTDSAPILYKNGYKDSSWISLMDDRILMSRSFLSEKGTFTLTIDDFENAHIQLIMKNLLSEYTIYPIVIEYNHRGRSQNNFAVTHEYALWAVPNGEDIITRKKEVSDEIRRNLRRTGTASRRHESPTMFYGIEVDNNSLEIIDVTDALEVDAAIPDHTNPDTTMVYPIDDDGVERRWYYGNDRVREEVKEKTVWAKRIKGEIQIHYWQPGKRKRRKTVWVGSELDASTFGSELLNAMFFQSPFTFPKSIFAVNQCIEAASFTKDIQVLDFFAGSGTTGHAVINLNRKDEGNRKYILVEMGEHFETVIKSRIQKVIYSKDWDKGNPISREGSSHSFKYIRLESFEDTLNNLYLNRLGSAQVPLLDQTSFNEDYILHYMLDFESRGSLLDLKRFETPFDYQLQIASSTVGETEATPVDLVETFNYLLGLHVQTIHKIEGAVVVRGTTRAEKQVLVIWRTVPEMDNDQLNDFFEKHLADETGEVTDIYVNGDNNLANIRPENQHWSVHLTEESFHRLMFEEG